MDRAGAPHPDPPGEVLRTQLVAPPPRPQWAHIWSTGCAPTSAPGRLTRGLRDAYPAKIDERSEPHRGRRGGHGTHHRSSRSMIISPTEGTRR